MFPEKKRHSQFLGSAVGLRQVAHVVTKPTPPADLYHERIVYVGCIHGGNEDIYGRLELLINNPPDYLIFTGDITGTPEMERLKKHFYDEKEKNPDSLFHKYNYFGDWAATLPIEKREELLAGLTRAAEKLLPILQRIKKCCTKIILLEGNWDNPDISGVNKIAGDDIKKVFKTGQYFRKHGFPIINSLKTLETKTTLHIFLPYITLLKFADLPQGEINGVQRIVAKAKKQGKTIVMVGHAEANWRMHHLYEKEPQVFGQRGKVIGNFGRAMALFCPHEVIYPHQHARIRDENGELVDIDSKYVLHVSRGGVRLVENSEAVLSDEKSIVATYVPLGFLAEEDFVKCDRNLITNDNNS